MARVIPEQRGIPQARWCPDCDTGFHGVDGPCWQCGNPDTVTDRPRVNPHPYRPPPEALDAPLIL